MEIPIKLMSDNKGCIDRECPNKECSFQFKINWEDVEEIYETNNCKCPMCEYVAEAEEWMTKEQITQIKKIVFRYMEQQISDIFEKSLSKRNKSKYINIT